MSELALQLIAEAKVTNTKVLDLGNCGLRELPDELFELTQLEELNLCNQYRDENTANNVKSKNFGRPNKLRSLSPKIDRLHLLKILRINGDGYYGPFEISDISYLAKLTELKLLDLSKNLIKDCSIIENLTNLQSINLNENQISDISFLENLAQLRFLNISSNEVLNGFFFEKLTRLQSLKLSWNSISDFTFFNKMVELKSLKLYVDKQLDYSFLEKLTRLHSLDLTYSKISDYSFLKKLINLKHLSLRSNKISDISILEKLINLQSLDLRSNKISDISILEKLINLQSLDLESNKISDISILEKLTNLQSLNLGSNEISDCSALKRLTNLQFLGLGSNKISDMSPLEKLTNLKTLSLGSNEISDCSTLKRLTNLKSLYLRSDKISDISPLEKLTNLKTLSIYRISDISSLEKLINLQTLDLSFSYGYVSDYSPLAKITGLQFLNLSHCEISDCSFLKKLTNLQSLDLSSNKISDFSFLEKLINLQFLNLRNNNIYKFQITKNVVNLKCFYLDDNRISEISIPEKLPGLQQLLLGSNRISDCSFLEKLPGLQELYIDNNYIKNIAILKNLTELQELNLSENQIKNIYILKKLTELRELNLASNKISKCSALEKLIKLQSLNLSYNQIWDCSILEKLTNLQYLDLASNQISDCSFLENLPNIYNLDLSSNQVYSITLNEKLTTLGSFFLRNNQLTDVSFLKDVTTMIDLHLGNNPIIGLDNSKRTGDWSKVKEYFARQAEKNKVKVQLPVKILLLGNHASGKSTFANFFVHNQLQSKDSTHILRIVNYPAEQDNQLPEAVFFDFGGQDYYHGLYRIYLSNQAINLIFWREKHNHNAIVEQDSNGLSIYNFNLNYWLAQKVYFERDYKTPDPTFLIKTHTDESNKETVPPTSYTYKKDFECCLSAKIEDHINRDFLKDTLKNEIETIRQQNATEEPLWYIDFLTFLYNHKPDNPFEPLTFEYILENHYERTIETEKKKADFLKVNLGQLHNSGIILFYDIDQLEWDENSIPKTNYGLVWTNPSALVEKLHKEIFNRDELLKGESPGITTLKELGLNQETDKAILQLLEIQKIIFHHKKENKYIIPNFLRLSYEFDGHYHKLKELLPHQFTLQFKHFIPFGLINQLMCYSGENSKDFCRNGIIFKEQGATVSIELAMEKLQISVSYLLEGETSKYDLDKYLFMVILAFYSKNDPIEFDRYDFLKNEFERKAYFHINIDQDSPIRTYSEEENRHFKNMLAAQKKDKGFFSIFDKENTHIPKDMLISTNQNEFVLFEDLNIRGNEILAYDENANSLNKNISKVAFNSFMEKPIADTKKIFVSYSKQDVDTLEKGLIVSLKNLERQSKINIWYDKELKGGDEWDTEIKNQLQKADVILLVVSPDFIATDYIWDVEIKKALERHDKGEATVIPIILRHCDWTGEATPFSKLNAIPSKGKPITTFENQDEAWLTVLQEIKRVID